MSSEDSLNPDSLPPNVYEDRDGNIWEKRNSGQWFVNGALWNPFPDSLMVIDEYRLKKRLARENGETFEPGIGYIGLPNMKWGENAVKKEEAGPLQEG